MDSCVRRNDGGGVQGGFASGRPTPQSARSGQPPCIGGRFRRGADGGSRGFCGALLLDVGLVLMLLSYLFLYGLGRDAFVFAAVGGPMLLLGIWLDRTWPRGVVFAVGMAIGCSWIYIALA